MRSACCGGAWPAHAASPCRRHRAREALRHAADARCCRWSQDQWAADLRTELPSGPHLTPHATLTVTLRRARDRLTHHAEQPLRARRRRPVHRRSQSTPGILGTLSRDDGSPGFDVYLLTDRLVAIAVNALNCSGVPSAAPEGVVAAL